MKKILFFHTQTLHARVSIPVALHLAEAGFGIRYQKNRPDFLSFGLDKIVANPFAVSFMNRNALEYVAKEINYHDEFTQHSKKIKTTFMRSCSQYDAVVSTTKDLPLLIKIYEKYRIPTYALGYQHIPVLMRIGAPFTGRASDRSSRLFEENPFTRDHAFAGVFRQAEGIILNNFTFLDKVFHYAQQNGGKPGTSVIIFHPGGYRNVITEPGASSTVSYKNQKDFMEKTCLPILDSGLRPVIKVHPLPARYHCLENIRAIAEDIEKENSLPPDSIRVTDEWFWKHAFGAAFMLTFGSSAIYELWAAGLDKVYVANFLGNARSKRFSYFPGIYLNTYEEFNDFLRSRAFEGQGLDTFTRTIYTAYKDLFCSDSAEKAARIISGDIQNN